MFVPDTTVYIMFASGKLPDVARALVERPLLFHCSVCLGELATGVANFDSSAAAGVCALNDGKSKKEGCLISVPAMT
ncbi:hypothetical protein CK222_23560 [Mesorhizobium sp. WSM3866]|uniref:hypothetical protein n=1 Tax=Mesorhizobium sp. WSM3866 TaxID=422271 RepID=UPI000BAFACB4|nr:hypothetical protein [Mesorhizobium sp. WSM3866]PBB41153.1 hypothetical protein CK222_23560 [Mesorhizobium sp. WSM3866]